MMRAFYVRTYVRGLHVGSVSPETPGPYRYVYVTNLDYSIAL